MKSNFPKYNNIINNHFGWLILLFILLMLSSTLIPDHKIAFNIINIILAIIIYGILYDLIHSQGFKKGADAGADYIDEYYEEYLLCKLEEDAVKSASNCKHGYPTHVCHKCCNAKERRAERARAKARKELGVVTTHESKPVEVFVEDSLEEAMLGNVKPFLERTFLECADLLPEEYRDKFIKNMDEDVGDLSVAIRGCIRLHEVLVGAFIWSNTPEGHKYWDDLEYKLSTKNDSV